MADLMFNGIDEMLSYFGSSTGSSTIADLSNIEEIARQESEKLLEIVKSELNSYFASYTPDVSKGGYERTGNLLASLKISPVERSLNMITFGVYFDPALALHPSLWGGEEGNPATLLSSGWHINWRRSDRVPMLSDFQTLEPDSGTHYLEHAVETYNKTNRYGFHAELVIDGEIKFM